MFESVTKFLFDFLKLPPRYLVTLCATAAFLLFSPESILKELSVLKFAQDYRPWLSIVLIFTFTLLGTTSLIKLTQWTKGWWQKRKFYKRQIERLNSLTEDEKQILRFYIVQKTKSNVLRINDGIVQGLVSQGIIFRSASIGNLIEGVAYNISDHAWDYLNIYPSLLEGTTNTVRTDKRTNWFDFH